MDVSQAILNIAIDALAILIPALIGIGIALLKKRLGVENVQKIKEELALKKDLALLAVKMAEQVYKDAGGEEKLKQACAWLAKSLTEKGIKISEEEVRTLVEAALRSIKDELGEEWANKGWDQPA